MDVGIMLDMHRHLEDVAKYIACNTMLTKEQAYGLLLDVVAGILDAASPGEEVDG